VDLRGGLGVMITLNGGGELLKVHVAFEDKVGMVPKPRRQQPLGKTV
jgi:hypothetical protein